MRIASITLILLHGLLAFAKAQSVDVPLFRSDFRVFPVLSANWKGIHYQPAPGDPMVELSFRSLSRSFETYKYVGPEEIRFFREDGFDEDGEIIYAEVARTKVTGSELLIFFKKSEKASEASNAEFKLLSMNDSPSELPMDHLRFVNFMATPFGCRFLDKNMVVSPGISDAFSLSDKLEEDIFIGLVVKNNDSHRVVLKNNWEFQPGNRHLILLLPPKKSGSYRIRAYRITEFVGENKRFNSSWTPPQLSGTQ